jgi:GNAT superfamily N-acetyltransferase
MAARPPVAAPDGWTMARDHQLDLLIAELARRELVELHEATQLKGCLATRVRLGRSAVALITPDLPMPLYNRIVGLGVSAPASPEEVADLVGMYPEGSPLLVEVLASAQPPALPAWLEDRGLKPLGACAVSRLEAGPAHSAATAIEVRRVAADEAELFGQVTAVGSGWPEAAAPLIAASVLAPCCRGYLAWSGGEPIAAAAMLVAAGAARLTRAATLPSHRRRGAHRALIQRRIEDAQREGCHTVLTENHDADPASRNPSFRNLRSAGFATVAWRQNYGRHASSCTV